MQVTYTEWGPSKNITAAEGKALKGLIDNNAIFIAPADKGNITVVMDTEDYNKKALSTSKILQKSQVHKDGKPPRPVMSALCSATYEPSKYLAGVLVPLVGNNGFALWNDLNFFKKTREKKIDPGW